MLQDVKIKTEQVEGQQCRVCARIDIPYSLEQVWQVLTDYETYDEFIPNLIHNRLLNRSTDKIILEQVRLKSFMGMKFYARTVIGIEEKLPNKIHYQLIEGDFKDLSGCYQLEPWVLTNSQTGIKLYHNFLVWPKRMQPVKLVEDVLRNDEPMNLLAIHQRVEKLFGGNKTEVVKTC